MFATEKSYQKQWAQSERHEDQRAFLRHLADQPAELRFKDRCTIVDTLDISGNGAKCRITSGFAPLDDDSVELVLLDGTRRLGYIRWSNGSIFGIEFDREIRDPEDHIHYDHMGPGYYQSIIRLQKKKQAHMPS